MAKEPQADIEHLEELAAAYRIRLRVLERQIADFGIHVPAYIQLDREQTAQKLAKARAELRRLRPTPPADRDPYPGLLTFQEADAAYFFGRDALVAALVARAGREPFLAVLGASGSGKSSVVRAGLIPMLKGGALPGSAEWRYIILRPGARPLDTLAAELTKLQGGDLGAAMSLRRQLAESDRALLAADMLLDRVQNQRLVLVLDQAEELWTLAPREQRDPFVDLLLVAPDAPDMPLLVVLTMRADFLHRAIEQRALAQRIERSVTFVGPMAREELREAIVRPAESLAGGFEPGLVDELLDQTVDRPGMLPLLEYTLQELWRLSPDRTMTSAALHALGGVEGGLARKADTILADQYTLDHNPYAAQLAMRASLGAPRCHCTASPGPAQTSVMMNWRPCWKLCALDG